MDRPINNQKSFAPEAAGTDPFALFARWFDAAQRDDPRNAAVVALATAAPDARPSLRMVLLKAHGSDGFVFYSDYESRKAAELTQNPFSAMTFWWPGTERQVRIEGRIEKISAEESDAYFATRPRDSQLSAWASAQSRVIEQPVSLDEARQLFERRDIPRPGSWGGYRLRPDRFEFWQGRTNRLHDRICFTVHGQRWRIDRLAP
jgi:pyridoxamine 5'-phosphate oxidase